MVEYKMGLFICPEVQMHNNQGIGSNSNSHGVEEICHQSPTSKKLPTIFGGTRAKKKLWQTRFCK
jgi:hypothetical protein